MFGFRRRAEARTRTIDALHGAVVAASRLPELYGAEALPDTVDGRFESLVLHLIAVIRRLRALPPPAADVAQDLIDSVFAHLELAMRESGVGDMGVPKRMKKLARGFYDRTRRYEAALAGEADAVSITSALADRLGLPEARVSGFGRHLAAFEAGLGLLDLDAMLDGRSLEAVARGGRTSATARGEAT